MEISEYASLRDLDQASVHKLIAMFAGSLQKAIPKIDNRYPAGLDLPLIPRFNIGNSFSTSAQSRGPFVSSPLAR